MVYQASACLAAILEKVRDPVIHDEDVFTLFPEKLLNFKACQFINAALHVAVRRSHPLVVKFLLRLGADCATQNSNGDTALLAAIRKNHDRDGNTAHHLAAGLVDRYDIFEELMRHCILEIDKMNSSGETALHLAVKCGNRKAIECLLQHNVDMYKRVGDSNDSKSALELAGGDESIQQIFAKYKDESSSK